MSLEIKAVSKPVRIAGSAVTARTVGGDISAVIYAIENSQKGDIIAVDSHGYTDNGILGRKFMFIGY